MINYVLLICSLVFTKIVLVISYEYLVLKETCSYYVNNRSNVFYTFLDASNAFDRINYCKSLRMLLGRGLPFSIIRILINIYTTQQACICWSGIFSDYFSILDEVRKVRFVVDSCSA